MLIVIRLALTVSLVGFAVTGSTASARSNASAPHTASVGALEAPTDLAVLRFKPDVLLRWSHSGRGASGFEVERAIDGASFTRVGAVARDRRTFRDRTATSGHSYAYRVRAIAMGIVSPYSSELLVGVTPRRAGPRGARSPASP